MRFPVPHLERMQVRSVHDGDTVTAYVDRARDQYEVLEVRLQGTFAPELAQTGGTDTRDYAIQWLADHGDGTDWPFMLETIRTPRSDKDLTTLSRYVGIVWDAKGESLNAAVIAYVAAKGYAHGIGS